MKQGQILVADKQDVYVLKLVGDVRLTLSTTLEQCMQKMLAAEHYQHVVVDLTDADGLDSTTLGLLAKLSIQVQKLQHYVPLLVWRSPDIQRVLLSMGFADTVYQMVDKSDLVAAPVEAIEAVASDEEEIRTQVLDAHRVLMSLNETNEHTFRDLVCALEQGQC
ncbi:STAS domain-containing protein [Salinispirillum marinum]|uniref:STAS domain-containing protein n=2 Tax=Saccharospirillaceae TaxID=255527 RepID=A0ABV8BEX3_9GAMM